METRAAPGQLGAKTAQSPERAQEVGPVPAEDPRVGVRGVGAARDLHGVAVLLVTAREIVVGLQMRDGCEVAIGTQRCCRA